MSRHNSSLQRNAERDMQIMTRIVTTFRGAIDTISRVDDGCTGRMRPLVKSSRGARTTLPSLGKGNVLLIMKPIMARTLHSEIMRQAGCTDT